MLLFDVPLTFGIDFGQVGMRDLIRVDHEGNTVEGELPVNTAAFVIHALG